MPETTIKKADLEAIVENVTNIPCADSPLQQSWVREALEGGGDGNTVEPAAAAEALDRLAGDVEGFANELSQRYGQIIARHELNGRTIYEPCLPDGEGHHKCVGTGLPADGDTPAIGPCACTCHQGVVVLSADHETSTVHIVIAADSGMIEGASLFRDPDKAADYAREAWRAMTGSDEPDGESLTSTHDDDHDVWLFEEQLDERGNDPQERHPEAFVRLVASHLIEGDCENHHHDRDACQKAGGCCTDGCDIYEPSGNDNEVTALYDLIATARGLQDRPVELPLIDTAAKG